MNEILMATYNGEKYIERQLQSIIQQTCPDWKLTVRDDGSTDRTREILERYAARYPEKITLKGKGENLGARRNFLSLLSESRADYIFFSDQDDIWREDKLAVTLGAMKETERRSGVHTPVLIHTDLQLIDDAERLISPSFWEYSRISGAESRVSRLLIQNCATGCAMCINRALADLCIDSGEDIVMHDWWIALIASAFGVIRSIPEPTVLYRQHGGNEIGAKNYRSLLYKWSMLRDSVRLTGNIDLAVLQARRFYTKFSDRLDPETKRLVAEFAEIKSRPKPVRDLTVLKNGYFKRGVARNVGLLLFI